MRVEEQNSYGMEIHQAGLDNDAPTGLNLGIFFMIANEHKILLSHNARKVVVK